MPTDKKTNRCQLNLKTYLFRRTQILAFGSTSVSPSANSEKMDYPSEVTVTYIWPASSYQFSHVISPSLYMYTGHKHHAKILFGMPATERDVSSTDWHWVPSSVPIQLAKGLFTL